MNNIYHVRAYRESDKPFVKATFLRGLYHGDSWFSVMPKGVFMKNYSPIAEALIAKSSILVACLTEDPDVTIGYSILNHDLSVMHWVFIKKQWRSNGISKELIPTTAAVYTHLTRSGKSLLDKYKATFNPFAV